MAKETVLEMKLDKPAKKQGGDRYACNHEGDEITFYLPQSISRPGGTQLQTVTVTIK